MIFDGLAKENLGKSGAGVGYNNMTHGILVLILSWVYAPTIK
jgi:hypothetical protein